MAVSSTTELLQEGLALHRRGAVAEAAARYTQVLQADPSNADANYYLGMMACQQGRFAEGAEHARQALANDPRHARAHVLLGRALSALGRKEEALASFERAIALAPDLGQAHGHRADVLSELGRNAEAIDSYDRGLRLAPDCAEDWCSRGVALMAVSRREEAIASFERATALKPGLAQAHLLRARVLLDLRRHSEALQSIDQVLAIEPRLAEAWLGRANVCCELKRYEEALAACDRALAIKPDLAEAWLGRGNVLSDLKRQEDAFAAYDRALALRPNLAAAWLGRANLLYALKQYDDAFTAYDRALALRPDFAEAWLGRGNVLFDRARYDDAIAAYDRALALRSDLAEAWRGRANALGEYKRYGEGVAAYENALALQPDLNYAAGARLLAKLLICDWSNSDAETAQLLAMIRRQESASAPFPLLAIPSSSADQLQSARRFVQDQPAFPPAWSGQVYSHDRIRIAYLSADFQEHAMGFLLTGLFEGHDKSRFEVTGISFGSHRSSALRERIEGALEHFIDARGRSDQEIADIIRRLEIDIAVDLMGFTKNSRFNVLARRPAPIQVNYLGYIGTMGAEFIDYAIADKIALPFDQQPYYAEKIVHLPDCFLVTDDRQEIAPWMPTREEAGLPPAGFVFCSFNNSYKLAKPMFSVWMRVLAAVPGSVLWLAQANAQMAVNLRREAQQLGVVPERLIFAPYLPLPQHLARQRLAGLFLDTIPYNAGATAAAALWSGVPLLTVRGDTFVGRMAASMLNAVGLPELVTHSVDEYETRAVKLANDPVLLSGIRRKLQENLPRTPLFDTNRFRRHIEQAYITMVDIHRRGEGPRSFSVGPEVSAVCPNDFNTLPAARDSD